MATTFDSVENLALAQIQDYKIDILYQKTHGDEPELPLIYWTDFVDTFLIQAIIRFEDDCDNLAFTGRSFDNDLTSTEKLILSKYFQICWLERELQNSAELNKALKLSSGYGIQGDSKSKAERINILEEETGKLLIKYQMKELF